MIKNIQILHWNRGQTVQYFRTLTHQKMSENSIVKLHFQKRERSKIKVCNKTK